MREYFDFIACREDVRIGKPEPDVYFHALAGLGVEATASLAFEDSVPGHVAAHRAGLRVIVVPNPSTGHCEFAHASLKLSSMADTNLDDLSRQFQINSTMR
jgi:putative hydrolase of the HAD superfamily